MSNKKADKSINSCIYCGNTENMTRDHIPPRVLFPKPRPSKMITVPCCKVCNESFSKDDEYFGLFLLSCPSVSGDPHAQAVNERLLRSIQKVQAPNFAHLINRSVFELEIFSPGGIYLGQVDAFAAKADRINRTLDRITRGLFFIIRQYPLPKGYKPKCFFNFQLGIPSDLIQRFENLWAPPVTIGNNIFSFTYILCSDDPNAMRYIFWFYGQLYFYGYILPEGILPDEDPRPN